MKTRNFTFDVDAMVVISHLTSIEYRFSIGFTARCNIESELNALKALNQST